jgi:DNA mismatch repair ATPase MutS
MPPGLDTNTDDKPNKYIKYLERVLELRRFDRLNVYINSVPVEYKKIPYQIEFLNKIFVKQEPKKKNSFLNIIQKRNEKIISELGMSEMNYGRISYLLLLQHCNSHNPTIISKLSKPNLQWLDDKYHLILTHNAIVQLDLIPQKENKFRRKAEIDSLLSVIDHNRTHLGKRALENLLQNPMLDPEEIQFYYDMVDEMFTMVDKDPLWSLLDKSLRELPDISRLQRKLE